MVLAGAAFLTAVAVYAVAANRAPSQMWYMLDLQIYRSGCVASRPGPGMSEPRHPPNTPFP